MEEGSILERGNHDALMKLKNGVYRKMVALQTEHLQA
jgi:ABC-type multidrug transport system fused ATPase/permease subunit